jgi:hypothetical protein
MVSLDVKLSFSMDLGIQDDRASRAGKRATTPSHFDPTPSPHSSMGPKTREHSLALSFESLWPRVSSWRTPFRINLGSDHGRSKAASTAGFAARPAKLKTDASPLTETTWIFQKRRTRLDQNCLPSVLSGGRLRARRRPVSSSSSSFSRLSLISSNMRRWEEAKRDIFKRQCSVLPATDREDEKGDG